MRFSQKVNGGGPSAAATTQCDQGVIDVVDGLPSGGLAGGTYDNIEVPPDKICVLDGVTVTGSVTAFARSQLFIYSSEIGVDVLGLSASVVQVSGGSTIGGNMDVQDAGSYTFATCAVDDTRIDGNLSCTNHNPGSPVIRNEQGPLSIGGDVNLVRNAIVPGHVLLLLNADIGGSADINRNIDGGHKEVTGNTVAQTLSCKKNDLPFIGGPNVANKTKGQCF